MASTATMSILDASDVPRGMRPLDTSDAHGPRCQLRLVGAAIGGVRERPVRRACDASLPRLGVGDIDLCTASAAAQTINLRQDEVRRLPATARVDR